MDQTNKPDAVEQTYRLLALCARAEGHDVLYGQLARRLENFTNWDQLPVQAEALGVAPLFWHHIRQSGLSIPAESQKIFKGLYLRHRRNNQLHVQTLMEILSSLGTAGIRPLVLKGLALAYGYYPDPALRPISDIDLLLKQEQVLPALELLKAAGYSVPPQPLNPKLLPKELTADAPLRDGTRVHVELHHYDPLARTANGHAPDEEFKGFNAPPQLLKTEQGDMLIPAPLDMLEYLSRHFARHLFEARTDRPVQLKWVADIVNAAERHAESIDWARNAPLLNRLEVFYSLSPLPEQYAKLIPIRQNQPPTGVNRYPQGWPQEKFDKTKQVGLWRFIRDTFRPPSEWWLRLYYGTSPKSVFWRGQIAHRARIIQLLFWAWVRRQGVKTQRS